MCDGCGNLVCHCRMQVRVPELPGLHKKNAAANLAPADTAGIDCGHMHSLALFANEHVGMLSLVDACLGRLPSPAAGPCRPLLRLLSPARTSREIPCRQQLLLLRPGAAAAPGLRGQHAHAALAAAAEDFYATNAVTFGGLGLTAEVCGALQHAGYPRPAHAQVSGSGSSRGAAPLAVLLSCLPQRLPCERTLLIPALCACRSWRCLPS